MRGVFSQKASRLNFKIEIFHFMKLRIFPMSKIRLYELMRHIFPKK